MQITASVFMSDDESGPHRDYDAWLEQIATHEPVSQYRHNGTVEDNADAHIKRPIMGREVVVAVTDGQLDFGTWEQIYYDDRVRCGYAGAEVRQFCKLDGARQSLARAAMGQMNLSARGSHRVLKLARTMADLAGCESIQAVHLAEALHYGPQMT